MVEGVTGIRLTLCPYSDNLTCDGGSEVPNLPQPPSYAGGQRRSRLLCSECGHRNHSGAHFCDNCGHLLKSDATVSLTPVEVGEGAEEDHSHYQDELEPEQALLVVKRGPNAGSTFLLEAGQEVLTIGRSTGSDAFLDDVTVSRKHAEIQRRGDGFVARDLGSLNGTFVNGRRVDEAELEPGDEIQIGKFKFLFFPKE